MKEMSICFDREWFWGLTFGQRLTEETVASLIPLNRVQHLLNCMCSVRIY